MNNENNVTAEVAALRQYLFDVWNWDALFAIAEERQGLNLSSEPYEQGHRKEADAIAESLNAHLSDSLDKAIAEADAVLKDLVPGPVRNAQVGGLLESLRDLQQPGGCWRQWTEREAHRYAEQQDAEQHEGDLPTPADAWADIEGDVHQYVAALVEHIDGHSAEVEAGPQPKQVDRIVWKGSGAELAFLFHALRAKDWIALPQHNGGDNYAAMARAILRAIEVDMTDPSFAQVCKPTGDNDKSKDKSHPFRIRSRQT